MNGPDRWVQPVTLEGRQVRLEPLEHAHVGPLIEVGVAPELWRWTLTSVESPDDLRAYLETALAAKADGLELPFAQIERASGRPVGSTRFLAIEPAHRRLEIGYTWMAPAWQRTAINSEAKLLLMGHAFEALGARRVEFKTDSRNEQSRRALAGIGATEEGTFRNHMLTPSGTRHSVYFSVIAEEWPRVRAHLEARLARLTSS